MACMSSSEVASKRRRFESAGVEDNNLGQFLLSCAARNASSDVACAMVAPPPLSPWGQGPKLWIPPCVTTLPVGFDDRHLEDFLRLLSLNDLERRIASSIVEMDFDSDKLNSDFEDTAVRFARESYQSDAMFGERRSILFELLARYPSLKFGMTGEHAKFKFTRRVMIPQDKYPDINFIGLILGAGGSRQKKMAEESGAKIMIKGRGCQGIRHPASWACSCGWVMENQETRCNRHGCEGTRGQGLEPLHVLVCGPTEASVERAAEMLRPILEPDTGSLAKDLWCNKCGEAGHQTHLCKLTLLEHEVRNLAECQKDGSRYKTSLCKYFSEGRCATGRKCRYAHGADELRQRTDLECASVLQF